MKRRQFIAGLGTAVAWPLAVLAQQRALPVIGFLNGGGAAARSHLVSAFWRGVNDAGWAEGRKVTVEYRWADNKPERLPALAKDLVQHRVSVVVVGSGTVTIRAVQAATNTIPIVFMSGNDPVGEGLVASLNRPDGNSTGVHYLTTAVEGKRLGLLRDLAPAARRIGVLVNRINPDQYLSLVLAASIEQLQSEASRVGLKIELFNARNSTEIDAAFAALQQARPDAIMLIPAPLFFDAREQIAMLATRLRLPAVFTSREFADVGGLMSYGTSLVDAYKNAGFYAGRILNGEKPADLPVVQSTKLEFVINLKTAKTLGLTIPPNVLALADEVIE
jgi:putative tryptophan/tyrosine transport system substrate-binding protein